jgi:hypothetical protein
VEYRSSRNQLRAIVNDWQLNGAFGAISGTPFMISVSNRVLTTPQCQQTADQVADVKHVGEIGASGLYYAPLSWRQPTGVRFGTSGRSSVYGPDGANLALSLFRAFQVRRHRQLEFRAEAFNITNTPKFGNPNGDGNPTNSMRITSTLNGYDMRQIGFGLRFQF